MKFLAIVLFDIRERIFFCALRLISRALNVTWVSVMTGMINNSYLLQGNGSAERTKYCKVKWELVCQLKTELANEMNNKRRSRVSYQWKIHDKVDENAMTNWNNK